METKPLRLGIVVPCYNEQEVLPETNQRLLVLLDRLVSNGLVSADSGVYFVDDGSQDKTWSLIEEYNRQDDRIRGIKLSRNRGHQNALLAGLFGAEGDALVSIDADLQDDVSVIEEMVLKHLAGAAIVYGVRKSRASDSAFKRSSAELYYKTLAKLGVDIVYNHADYRLLSRRALDCLGGYAEVNMFLRGIIPLIGFPTDTVYYVRAERFAGESKYPLKKMIAFALDGITSFSVAPLRMISALGFFVCFFSLLMTLWVIFGKLFMDTEFLPGWASSVVAIYFLGGIQILSIGVVGEYVAKIYMETKRRPRYFIEKVL
ncbi:MAG: glycosyltransferase family 2 protein [Motiliproteus sp.]